VVPDLHNGCMGLGMSWEPSEAAKQWQRDFVKIARDGTIWGTSYGLFRLDKETKTAILLERPPWVGPDNEDLLRIRLTFEAIGWRLAEMEE